MSIERTGINQHDFFWRLKHFVHNAIVHPLLPLAEFLDDTKHYNMADAIFRLHSSTMLDGDSYRNKRYL